MTVGSLKRFDTIGPAEVDAAAWALHGPLSGYLGGVTRGGFWVRRLEDKWAETFGVKHAIACNSGTSGLLAAAAAVGLGPGDAFACSPYTMSATAAAPALLGAEPLFVDIEDQTFCFDCTKPWRYSAVKALIVTNLFGHPADLGQLRAHCNTETAMRETPLYMIEDNAQSPFAMESGRYAGTVGHIGVFSLNVHKHIQCGEGGVCVTDDEELAHKMRLFINHSELAGGPLGLNLRMTEVTAAIALAQVRKGESIVAERIEKAEQIIAAIGDIPGLRLPVVRHRCKHVYYTIPFLIEEDRSYFVKALAEEGVPLVKGYVRPLYRLPAFSKFERACPIADAMHDRRLFYYENCAWDPTPEQIKLIADAFHKVAERELQ